MSSFIVYYDMKSLWLEILIMNWQNILGIFKLLVARTVRTPDYCSVLLIVVL